MKQKIIILALFMFIINLGCKNQPWSNEQIVSSEIPVTRDVEELVDTITITETISPETSELFTIERVNYTNNGNISELDNLSGIFVLCSEDSVVINNDIFINNGSENYTISIFDLYINEFINQIEITGSEYSNNYYEESPGKDKVAITQAKAVDVSTRLFIMNDQGIITDHIDFTDSWTFYKWLDNEKLLFRQYQSLKTAFEESFDLISYSIDNAKQVEFPSNFPGIYQNENLHTWRSTTVFNQDVSYVLYPVWNSTTNKLYTVLWNMEKDSEVKEIQGGEWPTWSPNDTIFALIVDRPEIKLESHNEIYLFNTNGENILSTNFNLEYEYLSINHLVWSPDGRYLAFFVNDDPTKDYSKLGVLDINNNAVYLYEIGIAPFNYEFSNTYYGNEYYQHYSQYPIWSPDSKFVVAEDQKEGDFDSYIFDIDDKVYFQITDDVKIEAWLR